MRVDTGYSVVTITVERTDVECPKTALFWQKWYYACYPAEVPCRCQLPCSQQSLHTVHGCNLMTFPTPNPKVFRWYLKPSMCKGPNQSKCEKSETYIDIFILCHALFNFIKNANPAFKILFSKQSGSHSNGISGVWSSVYWSQRVLDYDLFQNFYAIMHWFIKRGNKVLYMWFKQITRLMSQEKKAFELVHFQGLQCFFRITIWNNAMKI